MARVWPFSHFRPWALVQATVLVVASLVFTSHLALGQIIPADRNYPWNPGLMSKGGVPNRTTVCATLSPTGGNDSAAIQAKLDSCPSGQVVMLNPGTFIVNNYLLIHSAITLRGSGAGTTILRKTNGARARTSQFQPIDPASYTYDAQPIVIVGPQRWPNHDSSQNLTVDGQQGSLSVTIANASGYAAGQFVLLDETSGASWQPVPPGFGGTNVKVWQGDRVAWNMHLPTQPGDDNGNSNAGGPFDSTPGVLPDAMSWFARTDRPTGEIKEIASVSGNTITFTSPLTISYRTSHQAQLTQFVGANAFVSNGGVENLSVYGGADGAVRFENAAYSWAKNVEVTQWIGESVAIHQSFRVELRDSYLHTGSWPEPGGAGYIISLANSSSEILIENNILIDACKQMVMRSSGAGSVVAYNYGDDSWDFDTPSWVEVGLNASHMAGPHHVLFEGNYSQNADSDYTHGNAIYLTFFRNWLSGQRRSFSDTGNPRTVGLAYGSWWDSFVGNVLGRPGQMTGWIYTDPAMSCDASGNNCTGNNGNWGDQVIWKLGYDPERWGMNPDPKTLSTVIRDGNYDFLTNSQRWHNTPGRFVMPDSLYLTAKPAFFGSNPWPWIDPATGAISTLPAKQRYEAGTGALNSTVAVSASPTAGGTVSGGGTFPNGSSQTVTATAKSGFSFTNWTENGTVVSSSANYTFTLNGNRTLVANFIGTSASITVSASPISGGTVSGGGTFAIGGSRTVTATASAGFTFASWTENGTVVSSSASYTFTLNANRTLVANFNANPPASITVSASPSAGGTAGGGGSFPTGSSQTVTATASSGFAFANWTENGTIVSSSASYTFTVNGNRALVATFTTTTPPGGGTSRTFVSGTGSDTGTCTRSAPCLTFAFAHGVTDAGGEINCVDPGNFGPVTITKSVTIDCPGTFGGINTAASDAITVNAASGIVRIRNLSLNGTGAGLIGIRFVNGAALFVENCMIANFNGGAAGEGIGIKFAPPAGVAAELYVKDTIINSNGRPSDGGGIVIQPVGTGSARVAITRTRVQNNTYGIFANGTGSTGMIATQVRDSVASESRFGGISSFTAAGAAVTSITLERSSSLLNGVNGILAQGNGAFVLLSDSTVMSNATGLSAVSGGQILSYQDNQITGNASDGASTITVTVK